MAERVVALGLSILPNWGAINDVEKLDALMNFGVGYVFKSVGLSNEGLVFVIPFLNKKAATQIYISYTGSPRLIRTYNWDTQKWTEWVNL